MNDLWCPTDGEIGYRLRSIGDTLGFALHRLPPSQSPFVEDNLPYRPNREALKMS
jgi:hypothetical protein